ncbi:hypothetical protein EDB84DRAFT_1462114 [Lactarius hengduanensis]|nr:hypothetical protein EDB84DRAFT_1462114 [Lactarius hengduanensis]
MIIPIQNPSSLKANQPQMPHPPSGGPSPPPPPPPYTSPQSTNHYVVPATFLVLPESGGKRFIKAFAVAVLIWLLTGAFVSSCLDMFGVIRLNVMKGDTGLPEVEDGDIDNCPSWTTVSDRAHPWLPSRPFGSWSRASFSLPVHSDALYLIAHGALASGDLYVSESPEVKDVSVKVFAHHRGSIALSRATVCQLSRGDGQVGVGIFTPRRWYIPSRDTLHFVVEVKLPVSRGAIRYVPSFQADLPMFALDMGDISAFRFGYVSLRSTNSHIKVRGAIARTFNVHSTNGGISGAFNISNSLTIVTTNSPVSVKIGALNGEPEKPTEVFIQTTNGHINAGISLMSNSSSGTGGAFGVSTHTTNSPIEVIYDDSPVDSVLKFDAASTNSRVHTALHRAYEGTFALATTNSGVVLDRLGDNEDPSGQGRKRSLTKRYVGRNRVFGKVEWVPPSSDRDRSSSVNVATTNDVITLSI